MDAPERRLRSLRRHLAGSSEFDADVPGKTGFNSIARIKAFATDTEWAGKPFWMLNVLKLKGGGKHSAAAKGYFQYADEMFRDVLPKFGGKVIFSGPARTVVGLQGYDSVVIVEYPSPEAFFRMASDPFNGQANKNHLRLSGLEEQLLIPIEKGWFKIDCPAPAAPPPPEFTADAAWSTPSGLVGCAAVGARPGETSSTKAQVVAFVQDPEFGAGKTLWHLNLLRFKPGCGERTYHKYASALGRKGGVLNKFGARSTYAGRCYPALIGDVDFERAIVAEYPSRDSYLQMGSDPAYIAHAAHRHAGLEKTYIVAVVPELVVKC